MRKPKITEWTWGLVFAIAAFGLYSYYVRELLTSFALFTLAFLFLTLAALGTVLG